MLTFDPGRYVGSCTCPIFRNGILGRKRTLANQVVLPSRAPSARPRLLQWTMDDLSSVLPLAPAASSVAAAPAPIAIPRRRPVLPAWFAAAQVATLCGIPTQLFVSAVLILGTNLPVYDNNGITLEFFAMLSLLDTALVALLICVFLMLSGETSRDVFLGVRRSWREALAGLALVPLLLVLVGGLGAGLRYIAPWTHNVAVN